MDKEQTAIERLKLASHMSLKIYKQPLIVTISGGKDSSVCVELAQRAGIPFELQHSHTTTDAPETVYFVRDEFKRLESKGIKCTINKPMYKGEQTSMWKLIPKMLVPPTMWSRYCCSVLKESNSKRRFLVTGVRWAESIKRRNRGTYETITSDKKKKIILNNDNDEKRMQFETCQLKSKRVCNPIIDWTDREVWCFLESEHIPVNPLYKCGYNRVGCIGCPMAGKERNVQFARYPTYKSAYIRAFKKMLEVRNSKGLKSTWEDEYEVFHWWMADGHISGQMDIEGMGEDDT